MKQIIVNVSDLTIEEKQRVNEALAKIMGVRMCAPPCWDKADILYGPSFDGANVGWDYREYAIQTHTHTPQQVLEMAGMAKQGHVHAESMALYAEDAKTTDKPWELWQVKDRSGIWWECIDNPVWGRDTEYRRKPKTKIINGVEIPDFQFTPFVGCEFYCANIGLPEFHETGHMRGVDCTFTKRMVERGLIYPYTEEGKQAAILHAKAMLGIA